MGTSRFAHEAPVGCGRCRRTGRRGRFRNYCARCRDPTRRVRVAAAITQGRHSRIRHLLSALETWARNLASTAETGSFTLKEVIGTSRGSAPPIIRIAIDRMYSRMNGSWGNAAALRAFADEMDNAWANEVVIYLIQAAEFNVGGLTQATSSLADNLAIQVKQRMVIYNERDKPRRTMATMTGIIAFVLAGIVLFSATPQLAAYSTPVGEVV